MDPKPPLQDASRQGPAENGETPVHKLNPVTGRPTLPRAPKACARCRRQKLRCDPYRPCALCVRACVECVNQNPEEVAQTRRANKAKREEKKNREKQQRATRSDPANPTGEQDGHHESPESNHNSQSPEMTERHLSFDAPDEPPRKRPKYIGKLVGEPFPMPSFSTQDTERYIQRREETNVNSTSFSFDDRETTFNPMAVGSAEGGSNLQVESSMADENIRKRIAEIAMESNRNNTQRVVGAGANADSPGTKSSNRVAGSEGNSPMIQRKRSQRQSAMAQLLELPQKALAEFLIETYMFSVQGFLCCAHEPTFKKRYEELVRCREEALRAEKGGSPAGHVKPISLSEKVENHILQNLVRLLNKKMEVETGNSNEETAYQSKPAGDIAKEAAIRESGQVSSDNTTSPNVNIQPLYGSTMSKTTNQPFFESLLSALDVVRDEPVDKSQIDQGRASGNPPHVFPQQQAQNLQQQQQQPSPALTTQPSPVNFQAQSAAMGEAQSWPPLNMQNARLWDGEGASGNPYMQPYAYGLDWVARGGGGFAWSESGSSVPGNTGNEVDGSDMGDSQGVRYM